MGRIQYRWYERQARTTLKLRKTVTVPDQSMSVKEIYNRFVMGLPVAVEQKKGIYLDQDEFDYEKISRMDFSEKAALAAEMRARAADLEKKHAAIERAMREKEQQDADEEAARPQGEQVRAQASQASDSEREGGPGGGLPPPGKRTK